MRGGVIQPVTVALTLIISALYLANIGQQTTYMVGFDKSNRTDTVLIREKSMTMWHPTQFFLVEKSEEVDKWRALAGRDACNKRRLLVLTKHRNVGIGNTLFDVISSLSDALIENRTLGIESRIMDKFCRIMKCALVDRSFEINHGFRDVAVLSRTPAFASPRQRIRELSEMKNFQKSSRLL